MLLFHVMVTRVLRSGGSARLDRAPYGEKRRCGEAAEDGGFDGHGQAAGPFARLAGPQHVCVPVANVLGVCGVDAKIAECPRDGLLGRTGCGGFYKTLNVCVGKSAWRCHEETIAHRRENPDGAARCEKRKGSSGVKRRGGTGEVFKRRRRELVEVWSLGSMSGRERRRRIDHGDRGNVSVKSLGLDSLRLCLVLWVVVFS